MTGNSYKIEPGSKTRCGSSHTREARSQPFPLKLFPMKASIDGIGGRGPDVGQKRAEIYTYEAEHEVFAMNWSVRTQLILSRKHAKSCTGYDLIISICRRRFHTVVPLAIHSWPWTGLVPKGFFRCARYLRALFSKPNVCEHAMLYADCLYVSKDVPRCGKNVYCGPLKDRGLADW